MYDELIKGLREDMEWAEANEWETPIMLFDHLNQAADVIEELSKELIELKLLTCCCGEPPKEVCNCDS